MLLDKFGARARAWSRRCRGLSLGILWSGAGLGGGAFRRGICGLREIRRRKRGGGRGFRHTYLVEAERELFVG